MDAHGVNKETHHQPTKTNYDYGLIIQFFFKTSSINIAFISSCLASTYFRIQNATGIFPRTAPNLLSNRVLPPNKAEVALCAPLSIAKSFLKKLRTVVKSRWMSPRCLSCTPSTDGSTFHNFVGGWQHPRTRCGNEIRCVASPYPQQWWWWSRWQQYHFLWPLRCCCLYNRLRYCWW